MFVTIKHALITGVFAIKSTRIPPRHHDKEGRDDA